MMTTRSLNTQIDRYQEQGYVVVRALIVDDEIESVHRKITEVIEQRQDFPAELVQLEPLVRTGELEAESFELGVRKLFRVARHCAFFRRFAFHPRMVAAVQELLGPDLFLVQSMTLMKPPRVSTPKVWHQDNAYFRLAPAHVLGVWIAGDEATVENGCMHIVPGSHQAGVVKHAGDGDAFGIVDEPRDDQLLAVPLSPGDALIFHGELQHFTPANTTNGQRRSLQYHYAATPVRWLGPENGVAHFDPEVHISGQRRASSPVLGDAADRPTGD
ncbi:MAG: phytanoyl-CoA dioxygenase family protein [Planctomycetaceae bacterium]